MKIHGKQWLPFLGIQTEKKIIKNDALPHKPNCVEHVLSGDSTFFHAADYFSYLTNEKMLLQSSLLFIFFYLASSPPSMLRLLPHTVITYCMEHKLCAHNFSGNRKKRRKSSFYIVVATAAVVAVIILLLIIVRLVVEFYGINFICGL